MLRSSAQPPGIDGNAALVPPVSNRRVYPESTRSHAPVKNQRYQVEIQRFGISHSCGGFGAVTRDRLARRYLYRRFLTARLSRFDAESLAG